MNLPNSISFFAVLTAVAFFPLTGISDLNPLAKSVEELDEMVVKANQRLTKLQSEKSKAIPSIVLANAEGIVIIRKVKAGLGIGGEAGGGVALVRDPETGEWSAPAFVSAAEGSWGIQLGAQSADVVMVLMTEESLAVLKKGASVNIGVDVQAAAGPLNVGGDFDTESIKAPVLFYSDAAGLFAGAAFKGGGLVGSKNRNAKCYGATLQQILFEKKAKSTPSGRALIETIQRFAAAPVSE